MRRILSVVISCLRSSCAATMVISGLLACDPAFGQRDGGLLRPPAVPLIAHDLYFSIWAMADRLTDAPTRHWSGVNQELYGIAHVNRRNEGIIASLAAPQRGKATERALEQVSQALTPTRTTVVMQSPESHLEIEFLSPLFPDDLDLMARPPT